MDRTRRPELVDIGLVDLVQIHLSRAGRPTKVVPPPFVASFRGPDRGADDAQLYGRNGGESSSWPHTLAPTQREIRGFRGAADFTDALASGDAHGAAHKEFRPGIGIFR